MEPVSEALGEFLRNNPYSSLEPRDGDKFAVVNSWDDKSIVLVFPLANLPQTASCLNALVLPVRFSAIYHGDTKQMEFIYSTLRTT